MAAPASTPSARRGGGRGGRGGAAAAANGSSGGGGARTRSQSRSRSQRAHRPSIDVDWNGEQRHVPGSPSSSSATSSLSDASDDGADGEQQQQQLQRGQGGSKQPKQQQQQQKHRNHRRHMSVAEADAAGHHVSAREWSNMLLLVLLYAMQGIPLGLTMGAMPFLLQAKLTLTQMGLFSVAGYPYSFKLLWSPIVDSVYSARFGRRKSWIVPVQLASAALLVLSAGWIQAKYDAGAVAPLTALFFAFVLLAATQDVAVDGWALTLLPARHVEYASTCQTLGMNCGYFTSFTVFLALSNPEFCNAYARPSSLGRALGLSPAPGPPLVSLQGYVSFWGWAFAALTVLIALFKREAASFEEEEEQLEQERKHRQQQQRQRKQEAREEEQEAARTPARRRLPQRAAAARYRTPLMSSAGGGGGGSSGSDGDDNGGGLAGHRRRRHERAHAAGNGGTLQDDGAASSQGGAGGGALDWPARRAEIAAAYRQLWGVVRLPAIWGLSALLLSYRLGVLPAESAAALKLLDKGVAKESLAALVLVQFPVELLSAVIAGRWAAAHSPHAPFMAGYFVRLCAAAALTWLARAFPAGASMALAPHRRWFAALSGVGLVTSFASTLMFTALGSFFNRVSDPRMGGAYLTLLNTIANMGVILPKAPLLAAMDALTRSSCRDAAAGGGGGGPDGLGRVVPGLACPKKQRELAGSNACTDAGHTCVLDADGFYVVSYAAVALGAVLGAHFLRLFPRLAALPLERWRVAAGGGGKKAKAS